MDTIIVGVDDSESSPPAVRWALELAGALRSTERPMTVDVVRVLAEPPRAALGLPSHVPPSMVEERRQQVQDELADLVAAADPGDGSGVTARLVEGDPAEVLLELARDADLLVLGGSHLGRVSGAMVGSVAQRCIAEATAPVVIVPVPDQD